MLSGDAAVEVWMLLLVCVLSVAGGCFNLNNNTIITTIAVTNVTAIFVIRAIMAMVIAMAYGRTRPWTWS